MLLLICFNILIDLPAQVHVAWHIQIRYQYPLVRVQLLGHNQVISFALFQYHYYNY